MEKIVFGGAMLAVFLFTPRSCFRNPRTTLFVSAPKSHILLTNLSYFHEFGKNAPVTSQLYSNIGSIIFSKILTRKFARGFFTF